MQNKIKSKFTYEEYVERLKNVHEDIDIIGEYVNLTTKTLHKCKKCGYEWYDTPSHLLEGRGCSVCTGGVIGIAPEYKNSIWTSQYKDYFSRYISEEQMKSYMPHSGKKIEMKCPDCGKTRFITPNELLRSGFHCSCGDGISYPNKFMYGLLNQLNIEYKYEQSFDWSDRKLYDIYIPSINCIIENHGLQHYEKTFNGKRSRTLEQEQENDTYKMKLAKENGIKYYIVINCRRSSVSWIKNSIMNSELPSLLNFNEQQIDWNKCNEYATSSAVKVISELWNKGLPYWKIVQESKLSKGAVTKYLKKSSELGWSDYSTEESLRRGRIYKK